MPGTVFGRDSDGAALIDQVVSVKNGLEIGRVKTGTFAYIGSKCVAVRAIDTTTITLGRGILDTVPVDHADETRIWFTDDWQGIDRTERVGAETASVKLLLFLKVRGWQSGNSDPKNQLKQLSQWVKGKVS